LECTPLKVSGLNSPGVTSCAGPVHTEQSSGFKWTLLQVNRGIGVPRISQSLDWIPSLQKQKNYKNCFLHIAKLYMIAPNSV
jgi:hypothetical protein